MTNTNTAIQLILRTLLLFAVMAGGVLSILGSDGGGGGGDGGGGSVGSSPILTEVTVTPDRIAAGLTVLFTGSFTFTDADGNLNGGAFYYTYDETTYSFPLPPELQGLTSATIIFELQAILNSNVGVQDVPCWVVDNTGRSSNIIHVNFTQLWTRQFGTLLDDVGSGITTDSTGNVIVAGTTSGELDGQTNLGMSDVFITKYSSDASPVWTKLFGSGNSDYGHAVAVDSNDNIYVVGSTLGTLFDGEPTDGAGDGFISKFDASGNRAWTRLISTAGTSDSAYTVAVDANDNIYVAGETSGALNGETHTLSYDAFLVKYDVNGNIIWTRLLGTTGQETAYGVSVDITGNVYVTGYTDGVLGVDPSPGDPVINADAFVSKFDTSGALQWTTQLGTSCAEWAKGITVDASDNISIVGKIYQCALPGNSANGLYDAFLAKLDASGTIRWIKQFGTASHDSANSITADSTGNLYITGYLNSAYFTGTSEGHDIFLSKYDGNGNRLWQDQDSAAANWGNQGLAVTLDSSNSLFLTGQVQGVLDGHTNAGGNDVFILKYDSNGIRW